ncbi:peroxidase [Ranunculus cassubicifolius]
MVNYSRLVVFSILLSVLLTNVSAQLRQNYYANSCPNVETIVRNAVRQKFQQTFVTVPATLRLFFHDCFVKGCDASVLLASPSGNAEKDHPDDISLAGDGFDTVNKAKSALDSDFRCRNKVSCADILALATRDVVALSGGPSYSVELGRKDGRVSTKASVQGQLPHPEFNLDQLNRMFASHGLTQTDMIALSGAHTLGFAHCDKFSKRIYGFSPTKSIDSTLNFVYAKQLQQMCPRGVDPRIAINMEPRTPRTFDNGYYRNLIQGMGLFSSDQILFTDTRSRSTVNWFAGDNAAFFRAFVNAMTKLGRVGVLTGNQGEIRRVCSAVN